MSDVSAGNRPSHREREHEILAPVDLCASDGLLNPDAVGWSRHPWHDTDRLGRGHWGRNKRWEYWAFTTPRHIVGLTISSLDYAGVCQLWLLDRETGEEIDTPVVSLLATGVELPGTLGRGPARADVPGLSAEIRPRADGDAITAKTDRVQLDLFAERPDGHEALGVVVPWSRRLFQYTVKDVARPLRGRITVDGTPFDVPTGESWAVLDHGRGRWPYDMTWNWGAGSGRVHGADGTRHVVGLQLGGRWTVGTGSTENAVSIDGRLVKISDELEWQYDRTRWLDPWRISGGDIDLEFTPFHDRVATMDKLIVANSTHQCFGHYSGTIPTPSGERMRVDGLLGWAEHVRNRW